jgi:hypothetical protein
MAYLLDLQMVCDVAECRSRAVVELRDWRNESRGRFCRKHGQQRLRERGKFERDNPKLRG